MMIFHTRHHLRDQKLFLMRQLGESQPAGRQLVGGIPSNKVSPCPSVKPRVDKLKTELEETKLELLQSKKTMQDRERERVTPLGVDNKIYEPLLEAKEEEK
jgi:hypothetical protein